MTRICILLSFIIISVVGLSQTADFTFQTSNGSFCNPATVQYNQKCSGKPLGFIWDLGIGKDYEDNPSAVYTKAGTYTVKLTAVYETGSASVTKTITINPAVTASIGFDRNFICKPGTIDFTGITNQNIATYQWDFGDGTAPVITASDKLTHNFADFGTYKVSLTATSATGCFNTATTTVTVQQPTITASATPTKGCLPATVKFKSSVKIPVNSVVTSYTWDYGDGSPAVSTASPNINRVYTTTGTFTPTLTVTTAEGCTNSFAFGEYAFGTPPVSLAASLKKTTICGSETEVFHAKATNATEYKWNFGDGVTYLTDDTIINHRYRVLGNLSVKVTPYFNGCAGKAADLKVNVIGVIADYSYANTCADRKTYDFQNKSLGNVSSASWDFGFGGPVINTKDAVQTFPASGKFITELSVTDNVTGCKDRLSRNIFTANPLLLNNDLAVCKNDSTSFNVSESYLNTKAVYAWHLVGRDMGKSDTAFIKVKADTLGTFSNYVIINYGNESCPDSVVLDHPIQVRGPALSFTAPSTLCFNNPFTVVNTSHPAFPQDAIQSYSWNFGDTLANSTGYQPPPYLNKKTGKFNVKLSAIDINGCADSLVHSYTVYRNPFLHIVNDVDTVCLGNTVTLTAFHSDSIRWTPAGLLSCIDCDTVVATPVSTTRVYATAINKYNCTALDSMLVKVYKPFTASTSGNAFYICENQSVKLDVTPTNYKVNWSPAAGLSSPGAFQPVASPKSSTLYTATLSDSVGCFSSSTKINVYVKSLPVVDAGRDTVYPYYANFSFAPTYSSNTSTYSWMPVTYLDCGSCAVPKGRAVETQVYTVKVVSDSGCVAEDSVRIAVQCSPENLLMPGAFTPNHDQLNDYYYPLTRGVKKVTRFAVYNRFGQLVFESRNFPPNNRQYGWDGTFQGRVQPSSTYIYVLDVVCDLGETLHKQGNFILLR